MRKTPTALIVVLLFLAGLTASPAAAVDGADTIATVAGTGTQGNVDDEPTTAAGSQLSHPQGLDVDADGNLYIADSSNHRVRKVTTDGVITTIAGTGTPGNTDDEGHTATGSQLFFPIGIAVDADGNLYIAEYANHRIRKVTTDGLITTIAGTGIQGNTDDEGHTATGSQLDSPGAIAIGSDGDLYIVEVSNHRVRKVSTKGLITTVAGITGSNGSADDEGHTAIGSQLNFPIGIAVDNDDNLYIVDSGNHRIRKVTTDGLITTVAGITGSNGSADDEGHTATGSRLQDPRGVAVDNDGNLYIADTNNNRVRKVTTDGLITTIAGTGTSGGTDDDPTNPTATGSQLSGPWSVDVDTDGHVYIADYGNHRIRKISAATPAPLAPACVRTLTGPYADITGSDADLARLYEAVFTRNPDAGGFAYWQNRHADGTGLATIADFFIDSVEFKNRYGATTDAEFIELVYNNVMCRNSDAGGKAFWLDRLDSGLTRSGLMRFFADSPEFRIKTATN